MRRYACPRVHKIHNGHAFMTFKIYKRVHLPVYSTWLVMVITMTGRCRLGYVHVSKNKKSKLKSNETIISKRKSRSVVGYINGVTQFAS